MQKSTVAFKKGLQCLQKSFAMGFEQRRNYMVWFKRFAQYKIVWVMQVTILFFGCFSKAVKDYIPGTYATGWSTEFTEAKDTIIIEGPAEPGSALYQITRRTYMLYLEKPQYKLVHWTGFFNASTKTITVNNNGRVLSFDPQKNEMKMGSTIYKKLKP